MTKNTLNLGSVDIELNGRNMTLQPTFGAAVQINDHFGGMFEADAKCLKIDLRSISFVVGAGLDPENPENPDVMEWVYRAGLDYSRKKARELLELFWKGGKAEVEGDGTATENPPKRKKPSTGT